VRLRLLIAAAGLLTAIALTVGGIAMAQGGASDDQDERVPGAAADRAGAAAVKAVGAGKVAAVERDSDNAYEVEVATPDGSTVDVEINTSFEVVEVDGPERSNGAGEDESRDDADEDDGPTERDDDSREGREDD
jgi:hypothetical protein